jgi:hypothetical protein
MDAVKAILNNGHNDIAIEFIGDNTKGRRPFRFAINIDARWVMNTMNEPLKISSNG